VVISVANFESLSCSLGRNLHGFVRRISGRGIRPPHIWEIPRDHTHKFDYPTILGLARRYLKVESIRGVSLLWGFPWWPRVLKRIPPPMASMILRCLDQIAGRKPHWGDVLIVMGRPRDPSSGLERSF
jgi:hypothetical protein